MAVRFREMTGVDLVRDRLTTLSYGSAINSGTMVRRNPDTASADELYISTNDPFYMLEKDITATGPSLANKVLGVGRAEIAASDSAPVIVLVDGMELILEYYGSSGTGAITAATGAGTDLGVDANGRVIVAQASGAGSTKRFELLQNLIGGAGGIRIKRKDD